MSRSTAIPGRLRILQSLDRSIGGALCRRLEPRASALHETAARGSPVPPDAIRRILVIRPGGLGDAALTWPLLTALGGAYPAAQVDVLAERRNAGVFRLGDTGPGLLLYDRDSLETWRQLRERRYDVVIDTEQYHHLSVVVANMLRPRWLCGFDTLCRRRFHTHTVPHAEDEYEVLAFLRLAGSLTGRAQPFDPNRPFIAVGAEARDWAAVALQAAGGRRVAAIMPGAGGTYRLWPAERYAELARWLAGRDYQVALLGGPDAVGAGRAIAAAGGAGRVSDFTGRTSLAQTAAVLARSSVAISADTGVLHLAYGVGTPTVALFGPGRHRQWGPPGRNHRVVRTGIPCSPCTRGGRVPPCPIGVACMQDLSAGVVLAATGDLLDTLAAVAPS